MNSSFLYHAWGLYTHECTCEEYKDNRIILYVQAKERIRWGLQQFGVNLFCYVLRSLLTLSEKTGV